MVPYKHANGFYGIKYRTKTVEERQKEWKKDED